MLGGALGQSSPSEIAVEVFYHQELSHVVGEHWECDVEVGVCYHSFQIQYICTMYLREPTLRPLGWTVYGGMGKGSSHH